MNKILLTALLCLLAMPLGAAEMTAALDLKITSNYSTTSTLGATIDKVDTTFSNVFLSDTTLGAVDTFYHATRTLASGATESLGLVGSLTNSIGEIVSFSHVKAVVVQNTTANTFTVSGFWASGTDTVKPNGGFAHVGDFTVTGGSAITVTNSVGTSTYLIWIIGTR